MNNPVATISQVFLIATIAMLVVWLPLSNSNVLMNGIQTAKSFNIFYEIFSVKGVKGNSKAIEGNRVEIGQIIRTYKERETTKNNTSLLIKHQFW